MSIFTTFHHFSPFCLHYRGKSTRIKPEDLVVRQKKPEEINVVVVTMMKGGAPASEIGLRLGLTRENVKQIQRKLYQQENISGADASSRFLARLGPNRAYCINEKWTLYERIGEMCELADQLKISTPPSTVRHWVKMFEQDYPIESETSLRRELRPNGSR